MKKNAWLGVLLSALIVCSGLASVGRAHAQVSVIGKITIPGHWGNLVGITYDYGRGEIYVANYWRCSVTVMSDSNNDVILTIPLATLAQDPLNEHLKDVPSDILYDPGKNAVYATHFNAIEVIDDRTHTITATIPIQKPYNQTFGAGELVYDSGKGEIFVCDRSNKVYVINDTTNTVSATITVQDGHNGDLRDMAYDPTTGEIYVSNAWYNTVAVISDATNTVVATVPVGNGCNGVAYAPTENGTGLIYVANTGSNTISVISDATHTVVDTLTSVHHPMRMVYDEGAQALFVTGLLDYVSFSAPTIPTDYSVTAISTVTNEVIGFVSDFGVGAYNMAYDSGKGKIFCVHSSGNTVMVLSDSHGPVTSPTPTPTESPSAAISPIPTPSASVPEFPAWTALPLIATAALLAVFLVKRKKRHTTQLPAASNC